MEERNEISVELRALSELVSGISRRTPYEVPVGYFEQLPLDMLRRIAPGLTIFPAAAPTFQVPKGYFEGFAAQVLARIKAVESVDAELARLSPGISGITRVTPYRLPEGYFDELSPVLTVARDRSTYQAPDGYFAELPETILEKVAAPVTAAKVIPMRRDGMPREGGEVLKGHWWKYSSVAAIAACLLLIFSWPQVDTKSSGEGAMSLNVTRDLQKVSDQEMQSYLDDQHTILAEPVNNSTATLDMNEGEVKSLLGEVSDDDLQQYMEEHGKADDLATN